MVKIKSYIIISACLVVPNILIWTGILVGEGIIIQRDFNFPIFGENFVKSYFPLWNDATSQPNIERFPRLVMMSPFLALAGMGLDVSAILKIMVVGAFTVTTASMYLFLRSLLRYLNVKEGKLFSINFLSLVGAYAFAYNPANIQFIGGISIMVSVGTLPLLLYLVLTKSSKKYFPLAISLSLLFSLAHPFVFVMNVVIILVFTFIIYRSTYGYKFILSKLALSSIAVMLFFAWLWLPYSSSPVSYDELGRQNNLERGTFDTISDNNIYKIVSLERDRFTYIDTDGADVANNTLHYTSLAFLIIVGFSCLLFPSNRLSRKIILFSAFSFIICTILSLGSKGALGEPYWLFVSESSFGAIFRSPLKFQLYQGVFLSILFVVSIMLLKDRIRYRIILPALLCFIIIGSSIYGIYDANANSLNPIKIPKQYFEINEILKNEPDGYKVIYYPRYNELSTSWSKGHMIAPFDMKSSLIPTYETYLNYDYVQQTLYEDPYTTGKLKTPEYFDLLSSINIKYIVFHNDRGYDIDQMNLDYLINSNRITMLYNDTGWYLFQLNDQSVSPINGIYNIAKVNNHADIFTISSPHIGVVDTSSPLYNDLHYDNTLTKLSWTNNTIQSSFENELKNPSFDSAEVTSLPSWSKPNKAYSISQHFDSDGAYLQISTSQTNGKIWSGIISDPINVNAGEKYISTATLKTLNVNGSHVKIQGFYTSQDKYLDLTFLTKVNSSTASSVFGDSDWHLYWKVITIPSDVSMIRYVINGGGALDAANGNALTFLRDSGIYNLSSQPKHEFPIIKYEKLSPVLWKVGVTSEKPFILAFSETYDKGWILRFENGQEAKSFPLYGMINGYYIDGIGEYTLTLEYEPQRFFEIGAAISITFIVAVIGYFLITYRQIAKKWYESTIKVFSFQSLAINKSVRETEGR